MTGEEAHYIGQLNQALGNSLSSVWIDHNSKSTTYGCKAYAADVQKAKDECIKFMDDLKEKYK